MPLEDPNHTLTLAHCSLTCKLLQLQHKVLVALAGDCMCVCMVPHQSHLLVDMFTLRNQSICCYVDAEASRSEGQYQSKYAAWLTNLDCLHDRAKQWHHTFSCQIVLWLQALVKILENVSSGDIRSLEIPTGVPLVYELDDNMKPLCHFHVGYCILQASATSLFAFTCITCLLCHLCAMTATSFSEYIRIDGSAS